MNKWSRHFGVDDVAVALGADYVCRHACMHADMCADMWADMCADVCLDMVYLY